MYSAGKYKLDQGLNLLWTGSLERRELGWSALVRKKELWFLTKFH